MTWFLALAGTLMAALWLVMGRLYLAASRQVRMLSQELDGGARRPDGVAGRPPNRPGDVPPSLSVIITARDEAGSIEATVRHAVAQRHPGLEVIVVDDRSTDGTGAILDRLAPGPGSRVPLTVVHVAALPAGWIGKCHACHVGATRARGDWLLFSDGDVTLLQEDLLARVVAWAERGRLDHVGVFPDLRPVGPLQASLLFCFEQVMLVAGRLWEMERDLPRGGAGVGAFNLVRRTAYDRIGGHDLLRMEVADDYKLGMLLKESGARQRLLSGLGLVHCPWHRGAWAIVRGLEKNLFAGVEYSLPRIVWQTGLALFMQAGPLAVALAAPGLWGFAPLAVQAAVLGVAAVAASRRQAANPFVLWALYPVASAILVLAVWNSTLTTLRQGGVRWRETLYPIEELRRGAVRPGAGLRFLVGRGDPLL
jgi:GT2 family glycosyltransferase